MNIAVFERDEVIRKYNEDNGTNLSVSSHFGMSCLTDESLGQLATKLSAMIEGCDNHGTYADVTPKIDAVVGQYHKLRGAWYQRMRQCFGEQEFWKKLSGSKKNVESFKKIWETYSPLANVTSLTLKKIASELLPFVINYYSVAGNEAKRRKSVLPQRLKQQFQQYITSTKGEISDYHKILIDNMLIRLVIAAAGGNWKADDVLRFVAKGLGQQGLLSSEQKPQFNADEGLGHETFSFFVDYISQHGSPKQRSMLEETAWFQEDSNYRKISRRKYFFLVPEELAALTPRFYLSSTLFSHRYFRHQFFLSKKWLVCRLKTLNTHTKVPKRMSIRTAETLFEDLKFLESALNEAADEVESWRVTNWKRHFYKKTNSFVNAVSQYAYQEKLRIEAKRCEVIAMLRLRMEDDLKDVDNVSDYVIKKVVERAIVLCNQLQSESEEKTYFNNLLLLCSETPAFEVSGKAGCEPLGEKLFDEESSEDIITSVEIEAKGIFEITAQLDLVSMSNDNFSQLVEKLNQTIVELPKNADKAYLHSVMQKHFLDFLAHCHQLEDYDEFLVQRDRIEKIEALLLQHGPEFIVYRVEALIKAREEEESWFAFKILCANYRQSCLPKVEMSEGNTIKGAL